MPPRQECPESSLIQEAINALTAAFQDFRTNQDERHNTYLQTFNLIQTQIQELPINSVSGNASSSTNPPPPPPPLPPPPFKPSKLTLPAFDGTNPLDWLFQAEQFFNHYNIQPATRLQYLSTYMTGDALAWFQ
ncbi:hypothetical protein MTR_1g054555 [Medicago truncatula]|uniref:Retrotransposon gag domain-containing protein n=1 Tax=Medicago truncatula TaxID=3880 RepID=A0A072VJH7_MEDTR|nr:hypothetical protein MTR_1g054555 [Medicago truncatula]